MVLFLGCVGLMWACCFLGLYLGVWIVCCLLSVCLWLLGLFVLGLRLIVLCTSLLLDYLYVLLIVVLVLFCASCFVGLFWMVLLVIGYIGCVCIWFLFVLCFGGCLALVLDCCCVACGVWVCLVTFSFECLLFGFVDYW